MDERLLRDGRDRYRQAADLLRGGGRARDGDRGAHRVPPLRRPRLRLQAVHVEVQKQG